MKTIICKKRFDNIPMAHRLPNHSGHCAKIHGHNLSFEVTFAAQRQDECGFIIDFGKLDFLKQFLVEKLDHKLLVQANDAIFKELYQSLDAGTRQMLFDVTFVPSASAEGLANWLMQEFNTMTLQQSKNRVRVIAVEVWEDSKNSAKVEVQ